MKVLGFPLKTRKCEFRCWSVRFVPVTRCGWSPASRYPPARDQTPERGRSRGTFMKEQVLSYAFFQPQVMEAWPDLAITVLHVADSLDPQPSTGLAGTRWSSRSTRVSTSKHQAGWTCPSLCRYPLPLSSEISSRRVLLRNTISGISDVICNENDYTFALGRDRRFHMFSNFVEKS